MIATETHELQTPTIQRWVTDLARSSVEFTVRNAWGLASVSGRFQRFSGWYVEKLGVPTLQLSVETASVDTGNEKRDKHLRSEAFLGATEHPRMHFTSTRIVDEGDGKLLVSGELEVAGTPVPLVFEAWKRTFGDELEIEASTFVDQRDFGMSSGPLWSIRPPTQIHVKARLIPSNGLFG
jgi:polyisoprenoid-binding protein YceI